MSFFLKAQPQGPNPGPVCWSEWAAWPQIPARGQGTITPTLLSVPFQGELGLPGAPGIDGEKVSGPFNSLVMLCLMLYQAECVCVCVCVHVCVQSSRKQNICSGAKSQFCPQTSGKLLAFWQPRFLGPSVPEDGKRAEG